MTEEDVYLKNSIDSMVSAISRILADHLPSIYLYGSIVLNDFRLGWSDIDILVLTQKPIAQTQAQELVMLRQKLLEKEPQNPYYRSFEGGMLTLSAFCSKESDCVVYWGTSGQRITDTYFFDSFCMTELLDHGRLLSGPDIRRQLMRPQYADLYEDVKSHYRNIRQYAQTTDRSFYSFGWLLDIARGIYTLHSKTVASKTEAAQWVLEHDLCPVPEALALALKIRKSPQTYAGDSRIFDYAQTLGPEIQRFADVLEKYLNACPYPFL